MIERCVVCGQRVRIYSTGEGMSSYEGLDRDRVWRLETALRFYADKYNYDPAGVLTFADEDDGGSEIAVVDRGLIAREALNES